MSRINYIKQFCLVNHILTRKKPEQIDYILQNKKALICLYDHEESPQIIRSLNRIQGNKDLVILSVGSYSNTFCKYLFEDKFTVIYSNFDFRIQNIKSASMRHVDKIQGNRLDVLCSCSRMRMRQTDVISEIFYEDFDVKHYEDLWQNRDYLNELFLTHNVIIEPRYNCNKAFLESISLGAPVLFSDMCKIYVPDVYLTETNHKIVDFFNYDEVNDAIRHLSSQDNLSIHKTFIETANMEEEKFNDIIDSIDFSDFFTKHEMELLDD